MHQFLKALLFTTVFNQAQAQTMAEWPFARKIDVTYEVSADLKTKITEKYEIKLLKDIALQQAGNFRSNYQSGAEDILEFTGFTQKPDGRKIDIEVDKIITQDVGSGQAQIFTRDTKSKTLFFKDMQVGDTVHATVVRQQKDLNFPGVFSQIGVFPRGAVHADIRVTYLYPKALNLIFDHDKMEKTTATKGDLNEVTFTYASKDTFVPENSAVSPIQYEPRYFVTNMKSYEELGQNYIKLAAPKAVVTPEIEKLVAEITKGINDPSLKTAAIYDWVLKNIRYVAVYLGSGRYVPNSTEDILKNRFGDCKDMTTLLAAMLQSIGISSEQVLINQNPLYSLPKIAVSAFDHVILYVPSLDLYLDGTATTASVKELPFSLYGKPALANSMKASRLVTMPLPEFEKNLIISDVHLKVKKSGEATGTLQQKATGLQLAVMRQMSLREQAQGSAPLGKALMDFHRTPGTAKVNYGAPFNRDEIVTTKSEFTLSTPIAENETIVFPYGPSPFGISASTLPFGIARPRETPFICLAHSSQDNFSVELEAGMSFDGKPKDVAISHPLIDYSAKYLVEGTKMTVNRTYAAKFKKASCEPEVAKNIALALRAIRADQRAGFRIQ